MAQSKLIWDVTKPASLVRGLQDAAGDDATVVAIVDDITIMGTLDALSLVEQLRALLQKPANYLVNTDKQYVYTMNKENMSEIQRTLHHLHRRRSGVQSFRYSSGG